MTPNPSKDTPAPEIPPGCVRLARGVLILENDRWWDGKEWVRTRHDGSRVGVDMPKVYIREVRSGEKREKNTQQNSLHGTN